jgi:hypothetical protein
MEPALSEKDVDLVVEALDSHVYWQLSDHHYRSNADVVEPGSDDPAQAAEIEACVQLSDRLKALRPA